ncbi:hypothetical protein J8273_4134 [Carpediemonas membranifera]|uniref:Uncharacterized protein n=1 Tax=Carpediemonas membranifera TaxID=201153 RepID=A0A8J6B742_9EUKA|nr:hypothetical protein J8273_4134 [Carpediemonas membranifera]|eukprot:KAG9394469.1 hypothetical protein J8273_4134 [Carpediemonas membranifera]
MAFGKKKSKDKRKDKQSSKKKASRTIEVPAEDLSNTQMENIDGSPAQEVIDELPGQVPGEDIIVDGADIGITIADPESRHADEHLSPEGEAEPTEPANEELRAENTVELVEEPAAPATDAPPAEPTAPIPVSDDEGDTDGPPSATPPSPAERREEEAVEEPVEEPAVEADPVVENKANESAETIAALEAQNEQLSATVAALEAQLTATETQVVAASYVSKAMSRGVFEETLRTQVVEGLRSAREEVAQAKAEAEAAIASKAAEFESAMEAMRQQLREAEHQRATAAEALYDAVGIPVAGTEGDQDPKAKGKIKAKPAKSKTKGPVATDPLELPAVKTLAVHLKQLKEEKAVLEDAYAELQASVQELQVQARANPVLKRDLEAKTALLDAATARVSELEAENEALLSRSVQGDGAIGELRATVDRMGAVTKGLEADLAAARERASAADQLEKRVGVLNADVAQLQIEAMTREGEVSRVTAATSRLVVNAERMSGKLNNICDILEREPGENASALVDKRTQANEAWCHAEDALAAFGVDLAVVRRRLEVERAMERGDYDSDVEELGQLAVGDNGMSDESDDEPVAVPGTTSVTAEAEVGSETNEAVDEAVEPTPLADTELETEQVEQEPESGVEEPEAEVPAEVEEPKEEPEPEADEAEPVIEDEADGETDVSIEDPVPEVGEEAMVEADAEPADDSRSEGEPEAVPLSDDEAMEPGALADTEDTHPEVDGPRTEAADEGVNETQPETSEEEPQAEEEPEEPDSPADAIADAIAEALEAVISQVAVHMVDPVSNEDEVEAPVEESTSSDPEPVGEPTAVPLTPDPAGPDSGPDDRERADTATQTRKVAISFVESDTEDEEVPPQLVASELD